MEFDLEYNAEAEKLMIPEYGRHVQNLINYATTIEKDEDRQDMAEQIINLMHQMNPQNKSNAEYRNRLWKHLFIISDFKINVKAPDTVDLSPESAAIKPEVVPYPKVEKKFRHYGSNIKSMMAKAIAMEDGPVKDGFVQTIASFMKMAYKNWNREHYVSDEIVLADLETMSEGKLKVAEDTSLDMLAKAISSKRRTNSARHGSHRNNNNRNNNRKGGKNNRRKRR